jgi:DNA-binding PadR family transcriptional regulator
MRKLNTVDLEILHLAITKKGTFDENDLEFSELKNLGVGRILDQLASLKERKLIELNKVGSFTITNSARHILWDDQIPMWIKILRILEIKSQTVEKISSFLLLKEDQIKQEIEDLRKRQLVLMSPLRTGEGILKIYEILPEGIDEIKKAQSQGFQNKPDTIRQQVDILSLLEETIADVKGSNEVSVEKKDKIIFNLKKIKDKLEI